VLQRKTSTAVQSYGDARFQTKFPRFTALCLVTPQRSVTHAGTWAEKANVPAGTFAEKAEMTPERSIII
jgi:hypothetical protein